MRRPSGESMTTAAPVPLFPAFEFLAFFASLADRIPAFPSPALSVRVTRMVHENLAQAIEDLSARIVAIRDSL